MGIVLVELVNNMCCKFLLLEPDIWIIIDLGAQAE